MTAERGEGFPLDAMVSIVPPAADTYGTVSASVFIHGIKPMLQLIDLLLQHRDLSYLLVDDQVAHVEHLSSVFTGPNSHERRIGDVVIFQHGLGFGIPHPPDYV